MKSIFYTLCLFFVVILFGCESNEKKMLEPHDGYIEVNGGKIWYNVSGQGEKLPMLALHGGPGSSSYRMKPLNELATDRSIILFDQLGCGRSDRITDTTLMTIENYVEQVEAVRKKLDLDEFILYGGSWGAMLGIEYYIKYPKAIKAIIFRSPLFSTKMWTDDADILIATLPDSVQLAIRDNEETGTFDNPKYQEAVDIYYDNFLARKASTLTLAQKDTASLYKGSNVYEYMWGPSEFTARGTLINFDRLEELKTVNVPVLLMTGEYDEARPETVKYYASLIPDSRFKVIKNSGHSVLNDNKDQTLSEVRAFYEELNK